MYLERHRLAQKKHRSTARYRERRNEIRRNMPEEERVKYRAQQKKYRLHSRDVVIAHYGSKCACCGEANKGFLTIDHVDRKVPELEIVGRKLGSWALYLYLINNNFPEGYQLLCTNCNLGIQWWGICPHKQVPY